MHDAGQSARHACGEGGGNAPRDANKCHVLTNHSNGQRRSRRGQYSDIYEGHMDKQCMLQRHAAIREQMVVLRRNPM